MKGDTSAIDLHQRLDDALRGASVMVDAGCGHGAHLRGTRGGEVLEAFNARGGRIVGIDVALPDVPHPYAAEVRPIPESHRWPVQDESADVVFSDWVLEHVADPEVFFAECARVLRPGGTFVARTLQKWSVAGVGARAVPHRFHDRMIGILQPAMNQQDVFPTTLVCNTETDLAGLADRHGLRLDSVRTHLGLRGYGAGRPRLERVLDVAEKLLPQRMRHTIVITAARA